jgi:hypothetical protein
MTMNDELVEPMKMKKKTKKLESNGRGAYQTDDSRRTDRHYVQKLNLAHISRVLGTRPARVLFTVATMDDHDQRCCDKL